MNLAERLAIDLRRIGLNKGDVVLVRCATRPIAPQEKGVGQSLLDALLEVVGPEGAVVALTFTEIQDASTSKPTAIFTDDARTNTGVFASLVLNHPGRLRSKHPTNSIAAIGAQARRLVEGHNEDSPAFSWIERLIECQGKQLLIGCVESSPGLSTIHYTQEELGLSARSLRSGRDGAYVVDEGGALRWVPRQHIPGCSMGFGKMYGPYVRAGVLNAGFIGEAYAIMATAAEAAAVERPVIAANPAAVLCDRPTCRSCASWSYNLQRLPSYAVAMLSARARGLAGRLSGAQHAKAPPST